MLTSNAAQPVLSIEDFTAVRDFIYEKSGIWFGENKKYLIENRLAKRISELGIATYKDYFYRVKYDTSQKEFDVLMNLVTTNETSFFRNPPQLRAFTEEVLPLMIKEKMNTSGSHKKLKIWSAGCSTGEEPYTLGIIIMEKIPNISGWTIEIIANDISQQVLYSARKGLYQKATLRTTEQKLIDRYFIKEGNFYRIKDDVKRLVKFNHVNLNDPRQVQTNNDCDVIFCRNVMIYFSDDIKKALVKQFYKSLRPGGFFFIGHSESLHGISKSFKLEYLKNALVYKKEASTKTDKVHTTQSKVMDSHAQTVDTLSKIRELLNKK